MIGSPGNERRTTLRLLAYWEKQRNNRAMPVEQDIDPEELQDLWDNCFLIHVNDLDKPDYNYIYLGKNIAEAYRHGLSEEDPAMLPSPNANRLAASYAQVVESGKPLMEEGEFTNLHGEIVRYRQCLLPLGEKKDVQAIFGCMRFKVFSAV